MIQLLKMLAALCICVAYYQYTVNSRKFPPLSVGDCLAVIIPLCLAILFGYKPMEHALFELKLEKVSEEVTGRETEVRCNVVREAMPGPRFVMFGKAFIDDGLIVLYNDWCQHLMDYIDDPTDVPDDAKYAILLFTHEVIHIAGERDEQKTECFAIQVSHLVGNKLGVSIDHTKALVLDYFQGDYKRHPYFSPQCGPGLPYDQGIVDSVWV